MNKYRQAMEAGRSKFLYGSRPRTQFYVVIFACFVTAAIQLALAYRARSVIDGVIATLIWLVFAPAFGWYWLSRRGRK